MVPCRKDVFSCLDVPMVLAHSSHVRPQIQGTRNDPLRHDDRHPRPKNLRQSRDRAIRPSCRQQGRRMPDRIRQGPVVAGTRDIGGSDGGFA